MGELFFRTVLSFFLNWELLNLNNFPSSIELVMLACIQWNIFLFTTQNLMQQHSSYESATYKTYVLDTNGLDM